MSNGFCKGSLLIILSALVIITGSFNASAQTVTATGTVVDSSTGEPLIGAVVLLKAKSSTDHVITDLTAGSASGHLPVRPLRFL